MRKSVLVNNLLTFLNLTVALFVIFGGLYFFNWSNLTEPDGFFPFGVSAVLDGAAQAYFAFVGYDSIAIASEEALTPAFSIPFALAFDVLFVGCLYCSVSFSLVLLSPYDKVDEDAAFAAAFKENGWEWAEFLVAVGAIAAMTCAMLGMVFTMPRCIYAMATDGLIFKMLAKVNPKTQVPLAATLLGSLGIAIFAFFLSLDELAEFMSIGTLLAYLIIALAVIVLRYSPNNLVETCEKVAKDEPRLDDKQTKTLSVFVVMVVITNSVIGLARISPDRIIWLMVVMIIVLSILTTLPLVYLSKISTENLSGAHLRVPFVPFLPGLSVFINFHLMTRLNIFTWIRFAIWMLVGFVLYFWYGIKNSTLSEKSSHNSNGNKSNEVAMNYGSMTDDSQKVSVDETTQLTTD